jgi:hypothetical protein
VFYQDTDLLEKELIATAVITTPKQILQLLRFPQLGELAPAFARAFGFAEGGVATAESADIDASVGIGTLDSSLGAP